MEELIKQNTSGNEQRMTSLQIAEITGKPHNDVMKAIRKMEPAWVAIGEGKFSQSSYINSQNKEQPCYSLTQEECLYIATKFNDEARAKLIKRWKALEVEKRSKFGALVPTSFSEALMLAAHQQQKIEEQTKALEVKDEQISIMTNEIAQMQEKVSYVDRILACKSTILVTTIAQDYGMSAKAFNNLLRGIGIQHKVAGQWVLYSKYISQGYVHSKAFEYADKNGRNNVRYYTEWTQKGRLFLYDELKKRDVLPLIER